MLKATLGSKKIVTDTPDFSLDNMVEPTFFNFGANTVYIEGSPVRPGDRFDAGVSGMVMQGPIEIRFEGSENEKRNLMCYWGSPVSNC